MVATPGVLHWNTGRATACKPKAIQWLEEQKGAIIDYPVEPLSGHERHLSVRLTSDLATGLEALAAERSMMLSQVVRTILADAVDQRPAVASMENRSLADRLEVDMAEFRRRLVV